MLTIDTIRCVSDAGGIWEPRVYVAMHVWVHTF